MTPGSTRRCRGAVGGWDVCFSRPVSRRVGGACSRNWGAEPASRAARSDLKDETPNIMTHNQSAPSAARFLEAALLFTIVAHASAMASMLLLLPALPGGGTADDGARIAW